LKNKHFIIFPALPAPPVEITKDYFGLDSGVDGLEGDEHHQGMSMHPMMPPPLMHPMGKYNN
jgi:hypothetical protein